MAMRPNQFKKFMKALLTKNPKRVVFLTGAVGVGKSECMQQVADDLNFDLWDIRLSLLDATDLKGLPDIDKTTKTTYWTNPDFLPKQDCTDKILLFFDEFSCANASIQNACLQLMLNRKIGNYTLPENTSIVCAGNRGQDGAFVFRLSSAVSNRFINLEFEPDFDDWKEWAYAHNTNPLILGFHNYTKGEKLHIFKNDVNTTAFPSPRSWTFVNELLSIGIENGTLFEAIKGAIGEATATEFYGYMKIYRDLPNPEDILLKNKNIVPEESNIMYALCSALINCVREHKDKTDRLIEYSMKIQKEFSVVLIKDLLKTDMKQNVMDSKAFNLWVEKNKDIIL